MDYSPVIGPALFVALLASAAYSGLRSPKEEQGNPSPSTWWKLLGAGLLVAVVQLGLNLWIPWLGDALLGAAVGVGLFVTRRRSS